MGGLLRNFGVLSLALGLWGCPQEIRLVEGRDGSTRDAGAFDGQALDSGRLSDGAVGDGPFDAEVRDVGDLGFYDSGLDLGVVDATYPDATYPDATFPDAMAPDGGALDPRLATAPAGNDVCDPPGSRFSCPGINVCRFYDAVEGRCESCTACGNLYDPCNSGDDCDILFACYDGYCTNFCELGSYNCGPIEDCLDVGHPSIGVCRPGS